MDSSRGSFLFSSAMTERTEIEPDAEPGVRPRTRVEKGTKMPKADEGVVSPVNSPRWEVRIEEWQNRMKNDEKVRVEEWQSRMKNDETSRSEKDDRGWYERQKNARWWHRRRERR